MANPDAPSISQRARVVILITYLSIAAFLHWLLVGDVLPGSGPESTWLYAGFSMWMLSLLAAPWFTPPRDALASAVAALLLLGTLDLLPLQQALTAATTVRDLAVALSLLVAICSFLAMLLAQSSKHEPFSHFCYKFSDFFGRGEILFTPPALLGILIAFHDKPTTFTWLSSFWIGVVVLHPLESASRLYLLLRNRTRNADTLAHLGRIVRVDHPNLVRIAIDNEQSWSRDVPLLAQLPDGRQHLLLPLYTQLQGEHVLGTALRIEECVGPTRDVEIGMVYRWLLAPRSVEQIKDELCGGAARGSLAGIVVEGSTIERLRVEVSEGVALEEGTILFVRSNNEVVYFQILAGETSEETLKQNPSGKQIAICGQIGTHSAERGFLKYPWLPAMNQPVFLTPEGFSLQSTIEQDDFTIGYLPNSDAFAIADLPSLVDYHSAVLGVTGTGKTELVLDVVRHALRMGTKVFCVDFTGEYRPRLADESPVSVGLTIKEGSELEQLLFDVETGQYGAGPEKKKLKEFVDAIQKQVGDSVQAFLEGESSLGILELAEITNTKATLRATELFLSAVMAWARQNRKRKRVLIVLEEAHTIVPETAGAGFDFDTQWVVSRIGQIALQGRKYGVGLMVVTQRTALVSKTILSQCNTFLVHALIDQTSLTFLSSVLGLEHVKAIPNLRFLQFLAYGKAIRSERPLLLTRKFDEAKLAASAALDFHT